MVTRKTVKLNPPCSIANLSALADLEEERAMLDNMKETDILSDLDSNEDQPSAYNQHGL